MPAVTGGNRYEEKRIKLVGYCRGQREVRKLSGPADLRFERGIKRIVSSDIMLNGYRLEFRHRIPDEMSVVCDAANLI